MGFFSSLGGAIGGALGARTGGFRAGVGAFGPAGGAAAPLGTLGGLAGLAPEMARNVLGTGARVFGGGPPQPKMNPLDASPQQWGGIEQMMRNRMSLMNPGRELPPPRFGGLGTMEAIGRGSKEAFGPMLGGPKPNAPGFAGPLDPSATGFPGGPPIRTPEGWQPGGNQPGAFLGAGQPFNPQIPQVPPGWVPPGMDPGEWQRLQDEWKRQDNDPNLVRTQSGYGGGYR